MLSASLTGVGVNLSGTIGQETQPQPRSTGNKPGMNLRMVLRLRPPEDPTKIPVLERTEPRTVFLRDTRNERYEDKSYTFDGVYENERTSDVFESELGSRAMAPLFDGRHCTVFAHGATGSGKTYTMQGDDLESNAGFIPLAVRHILQIWEECDPLREDYKITFSLYELYCDKVRDLLQDLPKEEAFSKKSVVTKRWLGEGNPHLSGVKGSAAGDGKYRIDDLPVQMDKSGEEVVAQLMSVPIESVEQ
ncbi:unnamed protein product, partial [Amoebophrya sp. A25]|eukprot:GSA25T00020100001.1